MTFLEVTLSATAAAAIAWAVWERRRAQSMAVDPSYGIFTRVAAEAQPPTHGSIIFWDIDKMHQLNEQHGYEEVDRRISAAAKQLRMSRECRLIARWYSGDEFIYCCPQRDASGAAERIKRLFLQQAISVTIGVADITEGDWREAVRVASGLVQQAKREGDRGGIHRAAAAIRA